MKDKRAKDLLVNCVNYIIEKNNEARYDLMDIVGFDPKELKELGVKETKPVFSSSILNVANGQYITKENRKRYKAGPYENRLKFNDEADAEAVFVWLNDSFPGCFVIIDETEYLNQEK